MSLTAVTRSRSTTNWTNRHSPAQLDWDISDLSPDGRGFFFEGAATISGGATTAWVSLFENGELHAVQRVLIHGAAGGVGSYAVQLARWKGAYVIGTASPGNVEFVRSLGSHEALDYTVGAFDLGDVDLVLVTRGGDVLERSLEVVVRGGTVVSLLEQPPQERARERGIRAVSMVVPSPFPSTTLLQTIAQLLEEGHLRAIVNTTFPLHEAQHAHKLSDTGHGRGRIVLHITAD